MCSVNLETGGGAHLLPLLRGGFDPGLQAAVEQLLVGVDLLEEPLGLDQLPRVPVPQTHALPQTCAARGH